MKALSQYVTLFTVLLLAGIVFGWNDQWYLLVGTPAVLLLAVMVACWRRFRKRNDSKEPYCEDFSGADLSEEKADPNVRRSLLLGGLRGMLHGMLLSTYFLLWFSACQRVPWLYDRYYDADQSLLETKVAVLERADNHNAAANLIEQRLKRKLSTQWERQLAQRLYDDLVVAGQQLAAPDCITLYDRAVAVAERYDIDDTAATTLKANASRDTSLGSRFANLHDQERWRDLVSLLHAGMIQEPDSTELPRKLCQTHMSWAAACSSFTEKRGHYLKAVEVANSHHIEPNPAAAALELVELAIQERADFDRTWKDAAQEQIATATALLDKLGKNVGQIKDPSLRHKLLEVINTEDIGASGTIEALLASTEKELARQAALASKIADLRDRSRHEELISLLRTVVMEGDRRAWPHPYDRWLFEALIVWGDESPSLESSAERFKHVAVVCEECMLDAQIPHNRLRETETAIARRNKTREKIRSYREARQYAELAAYLRFTISERPQSDWNERLDDWLFAALMEWGRTPLELSQREAIYKDAVATAQRFGLNATVAAYRLAQVREELLAEKKRNSAVTLAADSSADIALVSTAMFPPVLALDLWIETASGDPISGLLMKDFAVEVNGSKQHFVVAPVEYAAVPFYVVLVLDTSESVRPSLSSIQDGGKAFLRSIDGVARAVKLISFNTTVTSRPWTTDLDAAARSLDSLVPQGKTALFNAVATAAGSMQDKQADKYIVVFTDGADTVGGLTVSEVASTCKRFGVVVHCIGLRTDGTATLDSATLQKLADETGGSYAEASSP